MVKKILAAVIAALTGPFAMALGISLLVVIGVAVGFIISANMDAARVEKQKAEKAAAAEALKGPAPPQRVVEPPSDGPSPFEPRYVSLGEEILSPLPGKGRVLITEVELVTQRGENAELLLTSERVPLRAFVLSILSEMTIDQATAPDARQATADKLKQAINALLQPKSGIAPVERVLIKKYFVQ